MNAQFSVFTIVILCLFNFNGAPPPPRVEPNKPAGGQADKNEDTDEQMTYNLEYERYLQEVVQLLESDPEFKAKLEKANPEDIKSGKIAEEMDFLHHGVRSKLNEIKRRELERLRDALREKADRDNGVHELIIPGHLDHQAETFEKEDLRKLVIQATKDLDELDKKRAEDFKEYEMKKELEWRQKLANMTEEERQKAVQERNNTEKKHNEHPDVVHPGSKAQLEDVWQKVDNLPKDSFDPNTFFQLHDLTGDGFLDTGELEALFQKELDKVYDKNNPEDDMRERDEEMARMREHVMKEWDHNKDGLISRDEFLQDTKTKEFNQDPGWETLEKKKIYSEDDLKAFAEQWARANGIPPQAMYPPYGQYPQQYPPVPQQPYYGGQPQYPPQQVPYQQQYPQGGAPPYQQYPPNPAQQQQYAQQQQWQQQQYQQQQWAQQQQGQQQQQYQPQVVPGQQQQQVPVGQQQHYQQPPANDQQHHNQQPVGQGQPQVPPVQNQQPPVQNQQPVAAQIQQQPPPIQNQPPPIQNQQPPVQQQQIPNAQGQPVQPVQNQGQPQQPPPPPLDHQQQMAQQPIGQVPAVPQQVPVNPPVGQHV